MALSSSKPGGGLSEIINTGSSANAGGQAKVMETVKSLVKLYCQRRIMESLPRVIGLYLVGTLFLLLPHCLRVKKTATKKVAVLFFCGFRSRGWSFNRQEERPDPGFLPEG